MSQTATAPQASTEAEAYWTARERAVKINAWLLWFFLGGFGAHLIYLADWKRETKLIVIVAWITGLILTAGTLGLSWLISWILIPSWSKAMLHREQEAAAAYWRGEAT